MLLQAHLELEEELEGMFAHSISQGDQMSILVHLACR